MTCVLVDDQLLVNQKIGAAIELFGGPGIVALWLGVATTCGASNTEGVVQATTPSQVGRKLIMHPPEIEAAVKVLVEVRLWHDAKALRRCEPCREHLTKNSVRGLPKGAFLFHGWGVQQFNKQVAKDPVARAHHDRGKELGRNTELVRQIRARDGEWCRYCGCEVNFDARRGGARGTYDHVDPNGPNTLANVVVACGHCNGEKKDRTPDEWVRDGGLALRPAPDRRVRVSSRVRNDGQNGPEVVSSLTGAGARVGTGRDGSETDLDGSGRVPVLASTNEGPEAA